MQRQVKAKKRKLCRRILDRLVEAANYIWNKLKSKGNPSESLPDEAPH